LLVLLLWLITHRLLWPIFPGPLDVVINEQAIPTDLLYIIIPTVHYYYYHWHRVKLCSAPADVAARPPIPCEPPDCRRETGLTIDSRRPLAPTDEIFYFPRPPGNLLISGGGGGSLATYCTIFYISHSVLGCCSSLAVLINISL